MAQPDPLASGLSTQQPKARPIPVAGQRPATIQSSGGLPVMSPSGPQAIGEPIYDPSKIPASSGATTSTSNGNVTQALNQPMRAIAPPPNAADTQTPSSGLGAAPPPLPPATIGAPTPAPLPNPATTNNGAVNLTPTDPNNPLTAQTITPGAMTDRFGIAKDQLNSTIQNILNPQFAADQRTLAQNAAARGQVGSGMLRTNLGNLDLARQHDLDAASTGFLDNALTGSIGDAYNNIGIAQQQQGFQNQQQQEAFNNSLQQLLAGSSGDPTSIELALSQLYGGQASAAGQAAASAAGANTAKNASGTDLSTLLNILGTGGQGGSIDPATQSILNGILNQGVPGVQTTGTY